jgi:hypothetical protein
MQSGQPLQIDGSTPRPQSEKEMWSYVSDERFETYQECGNSASMIDHIFDYHLQIA